MMRQMIFVLAALAACDIQTGVPIDETPDGGGNGGTNNGGGNGTTTPPVTDTDDETQTSVPPRPTPMFPSWHWEDAEGKFVASSGDSYVYVDPSGLSWTYSPWSAEWDVLGYEVIAYWDGPDCTGTSYTGTSAASGLALNPFRVAGFEGFFLVDDVPPAPRRTSVSYRSFRILSDTTCTSTTGTTSGVPLSSLRHEPTLRPPRLPFTPPLVRVRD